MKKNGFALLFFLLICGYALVAGEAEAPQKTITAPLDRIDLHVEPDRLWNKETGILAEGPDIDKASPPFKNAVYLTMAGQCVPAEMVYTSGLTGDNLFSGPAMLKLHGSAYTMCLPQKSFQVDLTEGSLDIPLFDDRPYLSYSSFVLDNAGEDCLSTRVADTVQARLIQRHTDLSILVPAWKPVTVYLNDEYWGQYGLRETLDAFTICCYEGIDPALADQVSICESMGGDGNEAFTQMVQMLRQSDPNHRPIERDYLEQHIDVESFLTWLALKTYFGDTDAASSFLAYRVPGGKWKCAAQDFNYGLFNSTFNATRSYLKPSGFGNRVAGAAIEDGRIYFAYTDNTIFLKILEVDEFREWYLTLMCRMIKMLPSEVMQAELAECVNLIKPEMGRHFARWASSENKYFNAEFPNTPDGAYKYWETRISRMKNTMAKRPWYALFETKTYFEISDEKMLQFFISDETNR